MPEFKQEADQKKRAAFWAAPILFLIQLRLFAVAEELQQEGEQVDEV